MLFKDCLSLSFSLPDTHTKKRDDDTRLRLETHLLLLLLLLPIVIPFDLLLLDPFLLLISIREVTNNEESKLVMNLVNNIVWWTYAMIIVGGIFINLQSNHAIDE